MIKCYKCDSTMPDDIMHGVMELVMGEQRDDEKIMLRPIGTGRRILCLTCATQLMQWMADGKHQFTLQMDSGGLSTSPTIGRRTSFNWWTNMSRESSSYFHLGDN